MTTLAPTRTAGREFAAIGTRVRLVLTEPSDLDEGVRLLADMVDALDRTCSRFRADSELVLLDHAEGRPTTVSPLLAQAVAAALRGAELSDGDVDPTLGRQLEAVGYDRDFTVVAPSGPPVTVGVRHVSTWRDVRLDSARGTLQVPRGVRLDLGATAKAWAADRAARSLAGTLGCGVLVSMGGDIAVAGQVPDGGWRVRVQDVTGDPADDVDGPTMTVSIRSGGLATSSTTARRWVRGGEVMHHILDPRTSLPAAAVWRTVTVAAASSLDANIASTASVVRGEAAVGWLQSLGLAARLVSTDGHVVTTSAWPEEEQS